MSQQGIAHIVHWFRSYQSIDRLLPLFSLVFHSTRCIGLNTISSGEIFLMPSFWRILLSSYYISYSQHLNAPWPLNQTTFEAIKRFRSLIKFCQYDNEFILCSQRVFDSCFFSCSIYLLVLYRQ